MNSNHHHGFTLIELVMVIVIVSILSATALPKFFDTSVFQERAFYDDTLSALRYAQKLAVATNCNVQVVIAGNQFSLKRPGAANRSQCHSTSSADFTTTVVHPGTGVAYTGSQAGVALTSTTIYFNALGMATSDVVISIGTNKTITVVKETGFVYASAS